MGISWKSLWSLGISSSTVVPRYLNAWGSFMNLTLGPKHHLATILSMVSILKIGYGSMLWINAMDQCYGYGYIKQKGHGYGSMLDFRGRINQLR